MTSEPFTQKVLMELLARIQSSETEISGEDVPVFERLLWWRFVFHNGATAEGYEGACTTPEGDKQLLTWAEQTRSNLGSSNDR